MFFLQNQSQAESAGVYAVEIAPPKIIDGVPNGYVGFVGQFAWGPRQAVVAPASGGEFLDIFEPAGSPRTSNGYRALKGRKRLPLKIVRAIAADAVAATKVTAGTNGNINAAAKYLGVLGNSISQQLKAAASGDAAKRDLVFTLTNANSGTTTEVYPDVPLPAGGVQVVVDVSKSKILTSLTIDGTMTVFPANATANLTGGSNGSALAAGDYTGTEGATDKGVALFEAHRDVRVVCHDDCGNALRAAVNAAFISHKSFMGDRMAVLEGNPDAADWATVKAVLAGAFIDDGVVYLGAWCTVLDDSGAPVTSPISTFVASALMNLEPQQSHSWWDDSATDYYTAIQSIVAGFAFEGPQVKKEALLLGICLPTQLTSGRWAMQHDRTTSQTNGKKFAVRRRVLNYLGLSLAAGLRSWVNGPNVSDDNITIKGLVDDFLDREKRKGRITAFSTDITTVNTAASLGAGEFSIAINATSPAPREKMFLLMNVGPTVAVADAQ
jgi:hypothetical protein